MTEAEWLACDDPDRMWRVAWRRAPLRPLLLCVAAWLRRTWSPGVDRRSWAVVEVTERYADGQASYAEFSSAEERLRQALQAVLGPDGAPDHPAHAALLRDILPAPSGRPPLDPAWRTPDVVHLAAAAYEARQLPSGALDPARLAVLGDALEEAGCTDVSLLAHCRAPGPHVRGCWVVDLALGNG